MRNLSLAIAAVIASASAAQAGGYSAPAVEVEPVVPVVVETPVVAGNWQGGYVGATLGYAFGGEDAIGQGGGLPDLGMIELGGVNGGVRAGYRWQNNRFVFGPELSIEGGAIKDEFDLATGGTFEARVNTLAALKLKAGVEVQPNTLVYGIAGVNRGDFTYDNAGTEIDFDANGYVVGLGAERMITDRISVTGEYEYSNFSKTDVELAPGITSQATPDFHNVKLGVNFKF